MQFWKLSAAAAAAALLLTGCSSGSLDESATEGTLAGEETAQTAVNPFTGSRSAPSTLRLTPTTSRSSTSPMWKPTPNGFARIPT